MTTQDLLQEALARVEAGESPETAAAGLPAEEAQLLRLAAAVRAAPHPARADRMAAHRAALLRTASALKPRRTQTSPRRWILPFALSGAFVVTALCALSVLGAGALIWFGARSGWVAQAPTPVTATATTPAVAAGPQEAALAEMKGVVEVQAADGSWRAASASRLVRAGERVRTGPLSSATLSFYDGSRARLGPNSELIVEALDAPTTSRRVIRLTQVTGESDHDVAKSSDPGSVYAVNTPSGEGTAKGTAFHVSVTAVLVRFTVSEGAVAVTNVNVTVIVLAGYGTLIGPGLPPAPPALTFSGEGQVQAIEGATWRIAGQVLVVTPETAFVGDPLLGDWVTFEGRLLPDGTRLADRITLLRRAIDNTFTLVGVVEAIGAETWKISGKTVRLDANASLDEGIVVSDTVSVSGYLGADGAFVAVTIRKLASAEGEPFRLVGVVQAIGAMEWTVSGLTVTVSASTTIESGIVVSDVVKVSGVTLADGTRLAATIEKVTVAERPFDFVGIVISLDPWNVSGVPLLTDERTVIDEGFRVGNRVRVSGQVQADGTYRAEFIEQLDNGARHAIQFTARVQSLEPWVIGGVRVLTNNRTRVSPGIRAGDLVTVKGNLWPDGTVLAKSITRLEGGVGCTTDTAIVSAVSGNTLTLLDGQTLTFDDSVTVSGQLQVASVIVVTTCVNEDGQLVLVSIVVILQLEGLPPTATPSPTPAVTATPTLAPTPGLSDKVIICHKPNNKKGGQTLTIDRAALPAHLGHGDTLGPCP